MYEPMKMFFRVTVEQMKELVGRIDFEGLYQPFRNVEGDREVLFQAMRPNNREYHPASSSVKCYNQNIR